MGDLIFTDFQTKDRQYTKGGGIDDLNVFARTMGRATSPVPPPDFNRDHNEAILERMRGVAPNVARVSDPSEFGDPNCPFATSPSEYCAPESDPA
jgi:hypothetical protein